MVVTLDWAGFERALADALVQSVRATIALDLVLDQADRLPREVAICAVAAPCTSCRNDAVASPRLDYRPLEDVIERWPAYAPALAEELKPGRGVLRHHRRRGGRSHPRADLAA